MSKNSKNARKLNEARQVSAQRKSRRKQGKKYDEAPRTEPKHGKQNRKPYGSKPQAPKKEEDGNSN